MKMKALISSIEPVQTGYRVAQVEQDSKIFPVADGLFWIDCSEEIVADVYWYDPQDQTLRLFPIPPDAPMPYPIQVP